MFLLHMRIGPNLYGWEAIISYASIIMLSIHHLHRIAPLQLRAPIIRVGWSEVRIFSSEPQVLDDDEHKELTTTKMIGLTGGAQC